MGSYSFFDLGLPIESSTAFEVPQTPGVQLHDLLTRFLNGSGGIENVVNSTGAAVDSANPGPTDVISYPYAGHLRPDPGPAWPKMGHGRRQHC